jgi:hypothetical protein
MFHERASAMMLSLVMFTQEARVQHVQRLSAKMVAEFDIEIDHPIRGFASLGLTLADGAGRQKAI